MQTRSQRVHPLLRCAAALLTAVAFAVSAPAQPAPKAQTINLPRSPITMIDLTNMVFQVKLKGTNLDLFITSQTRLFKDGKYATTQDFKEGDEVRGTMKVGDADRHEAVRLYTGKAQKSRKPSRAKKSTPAKKPAAEPAKPSEPGS